MGRRQILSTPPVYSVVKAQLLDRIADGQWPPGYQLPSENGLAAELGVSRTSVREALLVLQQQGYIVRQRGVGTFVADVRRRLVGGLEKLSSITEMIISTGRKPSTKDYSCRREPADAVVAQKLGVVPGTPIAVISRTRLADGSPVAFCLSFLPERLFAEEADLNRYNGSMFCYLETSKACTITSAMARVIATKPGAFIGKRLGIPEGESILLLEQVFYDKNGAAVMFSRDHFAPAFVDFFILRTR